MSRPRAKKSARQGQGRQSRPARPLTAAAKMDERGAEAAAQQPDTRPGGADRAAVGGPQARTFVPRALLLPSGEKERGEKGENPAGTDAAVTRLGERQRPPATSQPAARNPSSGTAGQRHRTAGKTPTSRGGSTQNGAVGAARPPTGPLTPRRGRNAYPGAGNRPALQNRRRMSVVALRTGELRRADPKGQQPRGVKGGKAARPDP